jgi:superfamily II DNA or RNA helicase
MKRGELAGIVNVGTLTTGVDADVRCIVLARPTKSEMLFVQMIGRGLRTAPQKSHCLILDHSDNHARLGFVTSINHDALLTGKEKAPKPREKEKPEQVPRECPSCGAVKQRGPCPACGFEPKRQSDLEFEQGELLEITPSRDRKPTMQDKQKFWSMALAVDRQRGKDGRLAKALYRGKFGTWPRGLDENVMQPDAEFMSYERSRRIAFAKRRGGQ